MAVCRSICKSSVAVAALIAPDFYDSPGFPRCPPHSPRAPPPLHLACEPTSGAPSTVSLWGRVQLGEKCLLACALVSERRLFARSPPVASPYAQRGVALLCCSRKQSWGRGVCSSVLEQRWALLASGVGGGGDQWPVSQALQCTSSFNPFSHPMRKALLSPPRLIDEEAVCPWVKCLLRGHTQAPPCSFFSPPVAHCPALGDHREGENPSHEMNPFLSLVPSKGSCPQLH